MQRLELTIDHLVLDGFDPSNRGRIGAALQTELTRLLTERGIPASLQRGESIPRLTGLSIDLPQDARPELIGTRLAGAIYRGLGE